jgi:cytochrome c biogenesis protein CcmG, thiol:disulfide interchange protein DsbE
MTILMRRLLLLLALPLILAACNQKETVAPKAVEQRCSSAGIPTGTEEGMLLPAYAANNLDGTPFDLATKRNRVVLVNLWATWCGPCRYEIPELQAIHDRFKPRGFEVIGVSVDEGAPEMVRTFVAEHKITYPIVLDPKGALADTLQTGLLPTTVLLDCSGKIVWKKLGAIMPNDEGLLKAIEAAL